MAIDYSKYGFVEEQASQKGPAIDYSQYGFVEDKPQQQAVQQAPQQPVNSVGVVPQQQQTQQPASQINPTLNALANNPITDTVISGGMGLRQGITDILGDVGGFATEILNNVGAISDTNKSKINAAGQSLVNKMDIAESTGMMGAIKEENPAANAIGRATGNVSTMIGLGSLGGASTAGQVASGAGLGAALAGPGNRLEGAAGGAVLPLVAKQIGASVGNFVTGNARLPDEIKNTVANINKAGLKYGNKDIFQAADDEFNKFRSTQGTVDADIALNKVNSILKTHGKRLTLAQKGLLEDVQGRLNDIKSNPSKNNLAELHDTRKLLNRDFNDAFFPKGGSVLGETRTDVLGFKSTLENVMQKNAESLGVVDEYKSANTLFKQSLDADQLNKAFANTHTPSEGVNLNKFNAYLLRPKVWDKLQPETKQIIGGVREVIKESNRILGVDLGSQPALQFIVRSVQAMTQVPVLSHLLKAAGTKAGKTLAAEITKALVNKFQANYINQAHSSSNTQEGNNNAN